jgi:cytochrome c
MKLEIELTEQEAWDLAQFLKRVTLQDFIDHSANQDEAYRMLDVSEKIRLELDNSGFNPR